MPVVLRQSFSDGLFGGSRYRVENLALAGDWSSEDDEPFVYERVHESRVLIPAVLLA